jgi:hypothetical protein
MHDALRVVVLATHSAAARHAASATCTALRALGRRYENRAGGDDAERARRKVARCFEEGSECVARVLRGFCEARVTREAMLAGCVAEAVGSVATHGVAPSELRLLGWGEHARLSHMCALIVAGAVNVDEWRARLPFGDRRNAVYFALIAATDAWAAAHA